MSPNKISPPSKIDNTFKHPATVTHNFISAILQRK